MPEAATSSYRPGIFLFCPAAAGETVFSSMLILMCEECTHHYLDRCLVIMTQSHFCSSHTLAMPTSHSNIKISVTSPGSNTPLTSICPGVSYSLQVTGRVVRNGRVCIVLISHHMPHPSSD